MIKIQINIKIIKNIIYISFDNNISCKIQENYKDGILEEDINKSKNYNYYIISTLDNEKNNNILQLIDKL